jgi:hypothetical protein
MMNFCTLFDSSYLSRGLLMHDSLIRSEPDSYLYIFAFDNLTNEILGKLNLRNATIISLGEFENSELINVKSSRTKAEYCWTCTSSVIKYVLDTFNVPSCTYLDADIFFFSSPKVLLDEIPADKSVMITEHRFSMLARLFEQRRAGRFCVQFITFDNTMKSKAVLNKWISQCIDWCYSRYEDGKFGDQKYLEHWPEEYDNVHILRHPGGGIAPWNVQQYNFTFEAKSISGVEKKSKIKFDVIFFHFHYVRLSNNGYADIGWNRLSEAVITGFYKPYIQLLRDKEKFLVNSFNSYESNFTSARAAGLKELIKFNFKAVSGYNIINSRSI